MQSLFNTFGGGGASSSLLRGANLNENDDLNINNDETRVIIIRENDNNNDDNHSHRNVIGSGGGGNHDDDDDDDDDQDSNSSKQCLLSSQTNLIDRQHDTITVSFRTKFWCNFYYLVDVLLSIVIFSPLVSIYWYATWSFLDDFFLVDTKKLSNFISYGAGLGILFLGYFFQEVLQNIYDRMKGTKFINKFGCFLMRTIYIYVMSFAVILEWRGLWNLFDFYYFNNMSSQMSLALVAIAYFCLTRSTRTLITTPFILFIDDFNNFFCSSSRYEIITGSSYLQYTFDFLLTEIVECFAQVAVWRGMGNFMDLKIFPNNPIYSIITSVSASHGVYLLVALIQTFLFKKLSKCILMPRLIVEDLMHLIMLASAVLAWKFYWDAIDYFIYSKSIAFELYVIGHFVTFFLAVILKVSSILVGPGTSFLDGDVTNSNAYFEIEYFSSLYKPSNGETLQNESTETNENNNQHYIIP